jgi:hypothetical protein
MLTAHTISPQNAAIRDELAKSEHSNYVHLSYRRLCTFPELIFTCPNINQLRRIDLGHNNITELPPAIYLLTDLRELWLQFNPIEEIPRDIEMCTRLEVLDLKGTRIKTLPPSVSTLRKLHELDWCETPFAEVAKQKFKVSVHDLKGLKRTLSLIYARDNLEAQLIEYLLEHHFARETDDPENIPVIIGFAKKLSEAFDDNDEFKLFVRRAEKLVPEKLSYINESTLPEAKKKFRALNEETQRNRLSADVEIKLRQVYFDQIERHQVDTLLHDIYKNILSLQDMEFFIKYIVQILPPSPGGVTGPVVWEAVLMLQEELTAKREGAIRNLSVAMLQMYPEQLPADILAKARTVAFAFQKDRFATKRELNTLSQIIAEVSRIFPPDYASVRPETIERKAKELFARKK